MDKEETVREKSEYVCLGCAAKRDITRLITKFDKI